MAAITGTRPSKHFKTHTCDGVADIDLVTKDNRLPKGITFHDAGDYVLETDGGETDTIPAAAGLYMSIGPVKVLLATSSGLRFTAQY